MVPLGPGGPPGTWRSPWDLVVTPDLWSSWDLVVIPGLWSPWDLVVHLGPGGFPGTWWSPWYLVVLTPGGPPGTWWSSGDLVVPLGHGGLLGSGGPLGTWWYHKTWLSSWDMVAPSSGPHRTFWSLDLLASLDSLPPPPTTWDRDLART